MLFLCLQTFYKSDIIKENKDFIMKRKNIFAEIWSFMWKNKAYWIFPAIIFLILLVVLIVVGTSPVSPFIYTII